MSTSLELRVADCLSLIHDHILKQGLDHPEGLTVTIPLIEHEVVMSDITVTAQIHVVERDDVLQQHAEQALNSFERKYVAGMEEQLRREHQAIISGNPDD